MCSSDLVGRIRPLRAVVERDRRHPRGRRGSRSDARQDRLAVGRAARPLRDRRRRLHRPLRPVNSGYLTRLHQL